MLGGRLLPNVAAGSQAGASHVDAVASALARSQMLNADGSVSAPPPTAAAGEDIFRRVLSGVQGEQGGT